MAVWWCITGVSTPVSVIKLPRLSSFEGLCLRIGTPDQTFVLLSVYRPGSCQPSQLFYDELDAVLESLVVHGCPVIIGGDFNIHVEDQTNHDATLLADRLESFSLVQHVNGATHKYGGTLDLIISGSDVAIESVEVDPPGIISDHALVSCCLQAHEHPIRRSTKFVRSWRRVDRSVLLEAIRNSPLGCSPTTSCPVELFEVYHSTLTEIADRLAPAHSTQSRICPLSPWFDAECRSIRRNCRRLENRYRRTKDVVHRLEWVESVRQKHKTFRDKENSYWERKISDEKGKPSKLWKSLSTILRRDKD